MGGAGGGGYSLLVCTIVPRALSLVAFFCGGVVVSPQALRVQAHGRESDLYCCALPVSIFLERASRLCGGCITRLEGWVRAARRQALRAPRFMRMNRNETMNYDIYIYIYMSCVMISTVGRPHVLATVVVT